MTKSKEPLARLIRKEKFKGVKYVLIPIPQYEGIYMAVAGDFLQTFRFHHCKMLYHMRMMGSDTFDIKWTHAMTQSPSEEDIFPLYDYNVTYVMCNTIEEFYQGLHQFFLFAYLEKLCDMSEHRMSTFTYMQVCEMEIQFLDAKDRIVDLCTYHYNQEDVPFQISANNDIAIKLTKEFGLNLSDASSIFHMPNICFDLRDEGTDMTWREQKEPVELFSSVHAVLVPDCFSMAYCMLDADEYDVSLRMEQADMYLCPMDFHGYESVRFGPPTYILPITGHFRVPRYSFIKHLGEEDSPVASLIEVVSPTVIEAFAYEFTDSSEIIFAIAYLKFILKHFVEFARVCSSHTYESYVDEQKDYCTSLVEIRISLDNNDYDHVLIIATDAFQVHHPTIEEVCVLLDLEEKSQ